MAEIRQISEKGKRRRRGAAKDVKTRKRKVKGYGVDRLRTAAERRMAESSEALAESLMSKALQGKLESVKILIKLAEEEKARKEEEREEAEPGLADLLIGSNMRFGEVWDGHRWRRLAKGAILEESEEEGEFVGGDGDVLEKAA